MYPWIKASGQSSPTEILSEAKDFLFPSYTVLAYNTDSFRAGTGDRLSDLIAPDSLLELRIFDNTREFWAHRSALGQAFSWRIADDKHLASVLAAETDLFLHEPENHSILTRQTLDVDATYPPFQRGERDSFGSLKLRTTGGGS